MVRDWKDLVSQKRAEVAKELPQEWRLPSSILDTISATADISVIDVPKTCGLLSSKELEITTKYDAVELVAKMAAKELSSYEVTLAFCKRAAIAHQVVSHVVTTDLGDSAYHHRPIALPRYSSPRLSRGQSPLTST
jgi:hypothetical protein